MWNEDGQQEKGNPARGPWDLNKARDLSWPHSCKSQEETIGVLGCRSLPTAVSWTTSSGSGNPWGRAPLARASTQEDGTPCLANEIVRRLPPGCGNDVGHHCSNPPTWSPPQWGDVNRPCATRRPNWTRKTPAGLSKRSANPTTGHVVSGMVAWSSS